MILAYSSGLPVRRLLDAILGTSPTTWVWAKRPSAVKIKMPLGVSPNGNDFLPSGAVTSAATKFQVPTIPSLRLVAGCAAAAPADTASASKAAAMVLNIMIPPGIVLAHTSPKFIAARGSGGTLGYSDTSTDCLGTKKKTADFSAVLLPIVNGNAYQRGPTPKPTP